MKAGEKTGFPSLKSRNRIKSIQYADGDRCKLRQNEQGRKLFYVQTVGEMQVYYHRGIPAGAEILHAVFKSVGEQWTVCLVLHMPDAEKRLIQTGKPIGFDVSLKSLAALSTDELIENPRWLRASAAKPGRLHRHASRQVKVSYRQRETYRQNARLHEQVANQREDYLHKVCNPLVAENDLIAIESHSFSFLN